jgi:hypothetical protein
MGKESFKRIGGGARPQNPPAKCSIMSLHYF